MALGRSFRHLSFDKIEVAAMGKNRPHFRQLYRQGIAQGVWFWNTRMACIAGSLSNHENLCGTLPCGNVPAACKLGGW
jgi:hypothetical protein